MQLHTVLEQAVKKAVTTIYSEELPAVEFQPTRKDFEGDVTVVVFPMLRVVKGCLLYTSPSPRDRQKSRMPSSA